MYINNKEIMKFKQHLIHEEKSDATIEKYLRDVSAFLKWIKGEKITKEILIKYKKLLVEQYSPASVNSVISSLNSFFIYNEHYELKIKSLKIQKQIFTQKDKELTKQEYERLLIAAKKKNNQRLYYLMQTICSTGIRVSELKYVTVEAVNKGQAIINLKGKMRIAVFPDMLCRILKGYIKENHITSGAIFVTKNGKPIDRSNIWADMKKICESANVPSNKVFPHNLRHLFAKTYYSIQKDRVRLADVLGHSNINTTRIYTMETGEIHKKQIQKLGLLRC